MTDESEKTVIAHSIISASHPRSFVSTILLAISVYLHARLETKKCVYILSSLSFADDYRELFDSLIPTDDNEVIKLIMHDFLNFIFDNADLNILGLLARTPNTG